MVVLRFHSLNNCGSIYFFLIEKAVKRCPEKVLLKLLGKIYKCFMIYLIQKQQVGFVACL